MKRETEQSTTPRSVLLLADDADDRRCVLEELLQVSGYAVISCSTVTACLARLAPSSTPVCGLLSKASLHGVPLLPALEQLCHVTRKKLTPLYLWSPEGALDLYAFRTFIKTQQALVFSLPLDVDTLLHALAADTRVTLQGYPEGGACEEDEQPDMWN